MRKALTSTEYMRLGWEQDPKAVIRYPNLVNIRTPTDGSCFFHALLKAYFIPYIRGKLSGEALDRKEFVRKLRKDLALKLGQRVFPQETDSLSYYQILANGQLPEIAKSLPQYSLESLQKHLDSSRPISNIFNEFISNELDKDIYILDMVKKDVYMTGTDLNLLYKDRDSIVILYMPGHYELIGEISHGDQTYTEKTDQYVTTLFAYDHPLIQTIKARQKQLLQ